MIYFNEFLRPSIDILNPITMLIWYRNWSCFVGVIYGHPWLTQEIACHSSLFKSRLTVALSCSESDKDAYIMHSKLDKHRSSIWVFIYGFLSIHVVHWSRWMSSTETRWWQGRVRERLGEEISQLREKTPTAEKSSFIKEEIEILKENLSLFTYWIRERKKKKKLNF